MVTRWTSFSLCVAYVSAERETLSKPRSSFQRVRRTEEITRQGDVMGSGFWASFRSLGELKGSLFKEMVFGLSANSGDR